MDNNKKIQQLIDKEKYQVFLCISCGSIPLNFAMHPWFVINKRGILSRWEVTHLKGRGEKSWNYLSFNFFPPFLGTTILPFYSESFYAKGNFKAKLLGLIEGDENSLAKRVADFIENSPNIYPYCNTYHFVGPNSNTYIQWVLDKFPDFRVKLPQNSFGKNYKT
jgi:hypothetical protein